MKFYYDLIPQKIPTSDKEWEIFLKTLHAYYGTNIFDPKVLALLTNLLQNQPKTSLRVNLRKLSHIAKRLDIDKFIEEKKRVFYRQIELELEEKIKEGLSGTDVQTGTHDLPEQVQSLPEPET